MQRFGWSALLIATVASCGYDELEGAGEGVEQVSSAVLYDGHDYYFFRQQASWTGAKAVACPDSYRLARINSAARTRSSVTRPIATAPTAGTRISRAGAVNEKGLIGESALVLLIRTNERCHTT